MKKSHASETQKNIVVLHLGPDMSAQGGIASVLSGYEANRAIFGSLGLDLRFAATCGLSGALNRLRQFSSAWWKVVSGSLLRKLDIVHIHTAPRGSLFRKWLLAMTCVGVRQRYVIHIHNSAVERYVEQLPAPCYKAVSLVWKHAAQIICLSSDMKTWFERRCNCDAGKLRIVHNGIVPPTLVYQASAPDNEPPVILFLGRLVEVKGVSVLLRAAEMLERRGLAFRLLFAGSGDLATFQTEVELRRLSHRVEYLGWVVGDEKARLLANADVFVLPSRSEGFPVAIVEAMAFGTSIVATNIPGIVDAVRHEHEALLVPPDDAEALCESLSALIISPGLRARLASAARQRFLDHFTIKQTSEQLADAYRKAIE
ncbi:glycosyltransferase family 4 protein [Caballeronia sp. S22]|uniref:glycosyltransferase family 4 protein n=1 Tax=Caballeronia sp. S22 TaxID=3137182 RepID=UPI003531199B